MIIPTIEVTIDEIVLHGMPAGQQYDFAEALEVHLAELIRASAGDAAGWRPRTEAGRTVAQTVHDSITDRSRR
jgi:hypothetical protein